MEALRIVLGCVLAATGYGILHDQVTARVCVEYFTIGHPDLFRTESPTLLAFGWGIVATWWAGLCLGVLLALAARAGRMPRLGMADLVPSILRLLGVMAASALVSGTCGYLAARAGWISLAENLALIVPPERHAVFLADGCAHLASYVTGFGGGLVIFVLVCSRRGRMLVEARRLGPTVPAER